MTLLLYKYILTILILSSKLCFALQNDYEDTELLSKAFSNNKFTENYYQSNSEIENEIDRLIDEKNKTADQLKEVFNFETLQQHAHAQYNFAAYVMNQNNKREHAGNILRQAYELKIPKEHLESKAFQEILSEIVEFDHKRLFAQMTYAENHQRLINSELSRFNLNQKDFEILKDLFFNIDQNNLFHFALINLTWFENNKEMFNLVEDFKTHSQLFLQQYNIYQDNINALKQIIKDRLIEIKG